MKQVKMNLTKEMNDWIESTKDSCKTKRIVKKIGKVSLIIGGGVGCFILGSKYTELSIARGLQVIFSDYPDVEKQMFEALADFNKNNNV